MAENKTYEKMLSMKYGFDDNYELAFLTPTQLNRALDYLSKLRRDKFMCSEDIAILRNVFNHYGRNFFKIKHLESQEPRLIAQKFISRRKIREFIFKRDGYKCLNCGTTKNLTLDHIDPVYFGGANRLGNIQTLCKSCNSSKSSTYIDFR